MKLVTYPITAETTGIDASHQNSEEPQRLETPTARLERDVIVVERYRLICLWSRRTASTVSSPRQRISRRDTSKDVIVCWLLGEVCITATFTPTAAYELNVLGEDLGCVAIFALFILPLVEADTALNERLPPLL
jgi:hypothetical protein